MGDRLGLSLSLSLRLGERVALVVVVDRVGGWLVLDVVVLVRVGYRLVAGQLVLVGVRSGRPGHGSLQERARLASGKHPHSNGRAATGAGHGTGGRTAVWPGYDKVEAGIRA